MADDTERLAWIEQRAGVMERSANAAYRSFRNDRDPGVDEAHRQSLAEVADLRWLLARCRLLEAERDQAKQQYEDLLGSIALYINWRYVTKQLTTEQKDLFADAVEAWSARLNDGDGGTSYAARWWRDERVAAARGVSAPETP